MNDSLFFAKEILDKKVVKNIAEVFMRCKIMLEKHGANGISIISFSHNTLVCWTVVLGVHRAVNDVNLVMGCILCGRVHGY